jgi:prepilin-type N-terminal cleavage/methylation domain-containing protein
MTQRRGFTLVEVMLALIIMGVVTGAIYKLLNTNQRLAVAQAEQVTLQSNVRTGSLIVPSELRELNTVTLGTVAQNDITDADPDGVEYRASRGLGFLCLVPAANQLTISQASWTGVRSPQLNRDDLYLFVDGDEDEDEDDTWLQLDMTAVTLNNAACGAGAPGWVLTVPAGSIPAGIPVNTPVRLYEVMRFQLTSVGGEWWLAAQSITAGEALTPVLGPLAANGFGLQYFDSTGAATADNFAIKSVRITVTGLTDGAVRTGGSAAAAYVRDTLTTQVLLRNSVRP